MAAILWRLWRECEPRPQRIVDLGYRTPLRRTSPGRMLEDATHATELDPKIICAAVVLAEANNAKSL
jgi:hypothetical protein